MSTRQSEKSVGWRNRAHRARLQILSEMAFEGAPHAEMKPLAQTPAKAGCGLTTPIKLSHNHVAKIFCPY
jgi:hypothetical protein